MAWSLVQTFYWILSWQAEAVIIGNYTYFQSINFKDLGGWINFAYRFLKVMEIKTIFRILKITLHCMSAYQLGSFFWGVREQPREGSGTCIHVEADHCLWHDRGGGQRSLFFWVVGSQQRVCVLLVLFEGWALFHLCRGMHKKLHRFL